MIQKKFTKYDICCHTVTMACKFFLVVYFGARFLTAGLMAQETEPQAVPPHFPGEFPSVKQAVPAGVIVPKEIWGSSVHGFRIALVQNKGMYLLGEPVCLAICLSNVSSRAIHFVFSDGWPWDYDLIITRNHGETVSLTTTGEIRIKTGQSVIGVISGDIRPGEIYSEPSDCISKYYDMSVPGEYEIVAVYKVPDMKEKKMVPVRSGPIHIQIITQEKR